jgi:hypothetical protein
MEGQYCNGALAHASIALRASSNGPRGHDGPLPVAGVQRVHCRANCARLLTAMLGELLRRRENGWGHVCAFPRNKHQYPGRSCLGGCSQAVPSDTVRGGRGVAISVQSSCTRRCSPANRLQYVQLFHNYSKKRCVSWGFRSPARWLLLMLLPMSMLWLT